MQDRQEKLKGVAKKLSKQNELQEQKSFQFEFDRNKGRAKYPEGISDHLGPAALGIVQVNKTKCGFALLGSQKDPPRFTAAELPTPP